MCCLFITDSCIMTVYGAVPQPHLPHVQLQLRLPRPVAYYHEYHEHRHSSIGYSNVYLLVGT
eukprot:SAG11_NODE_942_length_6435_cov_27.522096_6_plen_62_part_00